jgi:dihydroorotate dehydrogenase (NAD+) catalytic subunit
MGYSVEEFVAVVEKLNAAAGIDGFELNLSCPNVSYSARPESLSFVKMFAHDEHMIEEVVSAVRQVTDKTLIAKLGPDVSDIVKMALGAERSGADAVSLINTFIAMAIDVKTRKPILANKTGGLSGPCIRPIAVRMVWEIRKKVKIPILGIGGIMNGRDALEFLIAGASAVQVGTANFMNPVACQEILEGIQGFMRKEKIKNLTEIIGSVRE